MTSYPNVVVSVLFACLIHLVIGCVVLWKNDAKVKPLIVLAQGLDIELDQDTYQQIIAKQQMERKRTEAKKVSPVPKQPIQKKVQKVAVEKVKKIKLAKPKNRQLNALPQKPVNEIAKPAVVAYQVQTVEKAAFEENLEHKDAERNAVEAVKVASMGDTPAMPARQQSAQQKNTAGDGGSAHQKPLDMRDKRTKQYLAQLMRHLKAYKAYPAKLKKNHVEGKPVIRFSINKSGQVTSVEVKRRSSNAELDHAAMDVFRRASPLPKIPSELGRETLTMSLPIAYSLIND